MTNKATIKLSGYSEGDSSVGIGSCEFSFDTGLDELSDDDKKFIIETIIPTIWELHDNGTLHYSFSDEFKEEWAFETHKFGYLDAQKLMEKKND